MDGDRIGLGRSSLRTAVKLAPWELSHFAIWRLTAGPTVPDAAPPVALGLVWALVGANLVSIVVTRRRRTLYDLVAGTVVVTTDAG